MTPQSFSISKAVTLTGLSRRTITEIRDTLPEDAGVEQLIAAFVTAVRAERATSAPPAHVESRDPNEPDMPRGILSISALGEMFMLDRDTVRNRLRKEQIKPAFEKQTRGGPKFRGFRLTDKGKRKLTVKQILEAGDDPKSVEIRNRKLLADAKNAELKYEIDSKTIETEVLRQCRDEATKIFKALNSRIKRYWYENAKRLRKCKSDPELQRAGETDQSLILDELKRDYPGMFAT
jgi:hypothetical protein